MKPIIVASTLALSAMFAAGAAMAAPPAKTTTASTATSAKPKEHTANGVVKTYDASTHMLVLASGQKYTVDATGAPDGLKAGDKVDVKWIAKGKAREAETVTVKN
jgi:hypothetical protein